MIWLSAMFAALLVVLAVAQLVVVNMYARCFRVRLPNSSSPAKLPKAAVLLAVRGPDPFLDATLTGLIHQDYPNFTIFVIVDSPEDPVWDQLNRFQRQHGTGRIVTDVVRKPRSTCSLKCGALSQAVSELDPSFDVVAFIDGDAPPHASWLRELVAPLADQSIGVTTGNRWYAPSKGRGGSLVRYFWNAGAVVQVWLNDIVWAGSMAMRSRVIQETALAEQWQSALSVDGTVCRQMKRCGYRVAFVPSVMMVNEEEIGLHEFTQWVERQLVAARSAGAGWFRISLHAWGIVLLQALSLITLGWAVPGNSLLAACLAAGGLLAYWSSVIASVILLECSIARRAGKPFRWLDFSTFVTSIPALLLAHLVHPYAMSRAGRTKQVRWRGVEYEVRGHRHVRLRRYRPFQVDARQEATESVI